MDWETVIGLATRAHMLNANPTVTDCHRSVANV